MEKPSHKKAIGVKCIHKIKTKPTGPISKYNARLVVKGYSQKLRINYNETFATVSRHDTVRVVLALVSSKRWKVHQMDV